LAVSFEFATAGRILFGAGRAEQLPGLVDGLGTRALLCTGAHPERHAGLLAGLAMPTEVVPVPGEPTVADARAATETARAHGADLVIAVGGGSVLDLAKTVAALLGTGCDPLDHLEVPGGGRPVTASVPCVAVPTTSGTGSEVTANAVLNSPQHGVKASLRGPAMLPRLAVVDPLLTLGCPPEVTASSGLDALTQCLEPLVSVLATPLTDGLAREGLARAAAGLRRAHRDGSDVEARTDMAVCSVLGGISLANAKLGAVHAFAGVVGGLVDVPHGMACAALLAPSVEVNVRALRERDPDGPGLRRFTEVARILTGRGDARPEDGVAWITETVARLDVPGLGAFGLAADRADEVAAAAGRAGSMRGNPIVLTAAELREVIASAR